jgi:4-amino-4-deoxy-L-arabinose transferase-like glycosyltransferase
VKEPPFGVQLGVEVGMRPEGVGEATELGIDHDQRHEGRPVEQVPPRAPDRERRSEEQDRVSVGRDRETEQDARRCEDEQQHERRKRDGAAGQVWPWWAPALGGLGAVLLAIASRIPFWDTPLTADEGGYAEVARLWKSGVALYGDAWVDRPQGLMLVYRGLLDVGGGSAVSLRVLASIVAALVVVVTMLLALRICGTIEAVTAGVLLATFAASPWIESFTLSGELLAALPATLALLAFTGYVSGGRIAWIGVAGLLTGCAVMVKQSAFDGGLAIVAYLLLTERRRGLKKAILLAGAALVPIAAGAIAASNFSEWWGAVVAYRAHGDSLLTGSPVHRLGLLAHSLPEAAKALGLLAVLTAIGWRSAPLIARLWLIAAAVGVLGGGNFHDHYYVQLAPPLSLLGAVGLRRLLSERRRVVIAVCAAVAVATIIVTAPLWDASDSAQARAIWPNDPHLAHAAAVAAYVRGHTRPGDRIFTLWAAADVYYLADRRPAVRYMWYRNIQAIPGALPAARDALAGRRPALVVLVQRPKALDPSGATTRILFRNYRVVARVDGTPILARRSPPVA